MRSTIAQTWRLAGYRIGRNRDPFTMMPISVTLSVTNRCNSGCRTCYIWNLYREKPELEKTELELWEFDRIFKSLGKSVKYLVMSGGEPFLRKDLADICATACKHCRPHVITIPTNALLPSVIENELRRVLRMCGDTSFIVNLSLDAVGDKHDEIRGVKGNFESFMDTYNSLFSMKKEFPNLILGVHSVLSVFSLNNYAETYEFVRRLQADSYILEVAEERTELFNQGSQVTPSSVKLAPVISAQKERVKRDYLNKGQFLTRLIQASRLEYYEAVPEILEKRRQLQACYAGFASCQITPYGDVWPCCVLGYSRPIGNLREHEYDFKRIWFSERARGIRRYIKDGNCSCPLANAWYTSAFCNIGHAARIVATVLASYL
jgi:MoaA/NifB/PqqE/SkfB family radical SAM enzyme